MVFLMGTKVSAEDCPSFCTLIYEPICVGNAADSLNDQTFGNECAYKVHNCQQKISK